MLFLRRSVVTFLFFFGRLQIFLLAIPNIKNDKLSPQLVRCTGFDDALVVTLGILCFGSVDQGFIARDAMPKRWALRCEPPV